MTSTQNYCSQFTLNKKVQECIEQFNKDEDKLSRIVENLRKRAELFMCSRKWRPIRALVVIILNVSSNVPIIPTFCNTCQ